MKKLYTLSFTLLAAVASFAQTTEHFTGTGALNANGWVHNSGNTPDQLTIVTTASDSGNSLSFAGLAPSSGNRTSIIAGNSEDSNKALTAPLTGTIYYSFLIKALNTDGLWANGAGSDYFLALGSTAGTTVNILQGRLYIRQGVGANTFNVGLVNGAGPGSTPSFVETDLNTGTTQFIVIKYDLATSTASLFLNPAPGSAESTATLTNNSSTGAAPAQIASVVIRQGGNATTGTGNVEIDEIRVANTWADVTPVNLATQDFAIAGLKVYPNPVKGGNLYITSDSNDTKTVAIYSVLGKQVLTANVNDAPVNVAHLSAGVYIVKITEAGKTATKKLVIE